MSDPLSASELRVLGSLIEKESTTPEYYPMTLNGLLAACNQKTNRFPVTELTEDDIVSAIDNLKSRGYAVSITGSGRSIKYAQRFTEKLNMGRRETAILCILMLRGQQTVGEIKGRTERIYGFADLDETETVLQKLIDRAEGPLVQKLPNAPGAKEPRFAQMLGGPVDVQSMPQPAVSLAGSSTDRLNTLESEVAKLREEVAELRRRLDEVLN